ncbi:DUF1127 domain-containing protein [Azospirillum formosense]|uniref:DUF1127 domain-containing protein n=2 Tax=Azospirillum formosense TaxID=861533 RepID=A0ABX2L2M2_9PROT|nr:DUF1127 domain-containing protein [Azospirillum formosense]NUB21389.1 DUF1127 domain-containing protein [Azospirillum formosense]
MVSTGQAGDGAQGFVKRALGEVLGMIARHRQRRSLAALDDHLLRDVGLSRTEARREADKAFWQE